MSDSRFNIEVTEVKNKDGAVSKRIRINRRMFVNTYKTPDDKRPDYKADDAQGFSDIAAWAKSGTYEDKKTGEVKQYDAVDVTMYITPEELKSILDTVGS